MNAEISVMPKISNEREFKQALASLSSADEHVVGALFLRNLAGVITDPRIKNAIDVALDSNSTPAEREDAYKISKSIATATFTHLGETLDPGRQALYFLAMATAYCLLPEHLRPHYCKKQASLAIALYARMARCWSDMALGREGEDSREEEAQYRILEDFIDRR
jgi:hypothetical protein